MPPRFSYSTDYLLHRGCPSLSSRVCPATIILWHPTIPASDSDWPDPKRFAYTFDHYAEIMHQFTEGLGLSRYTLYMQDF